MAMSDLGATGAEVNQTLEQVARTAYGRLVAWLAFQWRDIAAAEDALAEALLKALQHWPDSGIPNNPDAWLLTVAKRELLQQHRRKSLLADSEFIQLFNEVSEDDLVERSSFALPDHRLALMLTCTHPAIDEAVRMPLMLQTVLGFSVEQIAPALLMSPASLAQRLVRVKKKLKATHYVFELAETCDLPQGIHTLLEAIYGAFGVSSDDMYGAEIRSLGLQREAIYLCELLCELLPQAAEPKGLLALMLFCSARQPAQMAGGDSFIPLLQQDVALWDSAMIKRADQLLLTAFALRQPGYFQLEAAVQSAHCHRLFSGFTPWQAIAALYRQMNAYFPTWGSRVAGAVALAEAGELEAAWVQLQSLDESVARNFQPWWVAQAHLLTIKGDKAAAKRAYQQAIGLSMHKKIIDHLVRQCDSL
jgi:RNA polymerase sigma-70 factor, ECF subfamily